MARVSKDTEVSRENDVITLKSVATVSEAFGQKFNPAKEIEFTFKRYANKQAAIASGVWPSDADVFVLAKVNSDSKTAARASEMNEALKEYKAAYEQSDEYKFKQLVDSLVANGMEKAEAEQMATAIQSKNKK